MSCAVIPSFCFFCINQIPCQYYGNIFRVWQWTKKGLHMVQIMCEIWIEWYLRACKKNFTKAIKLKQFWPLFQRLVLCQGLGDGCRLYVDSWWSLDELWVLWEKYDMVFILHHFLSWIQLWWWLCNPESVIWEKYDIILILLFFEVNSTDGDYISWRVLCEKNMICRWIHHFHPYCE